MLLVLRRVLMVSVLWGLLTGGAVIVCSTGDGSLDNRAPVARDDDYSVPAGMTLLGSARATDPDGDPLSFRVVSGPTLGRLQSFNSATGAFRYVSDTSGSDSFEFRASDGRRDSNTGRVRIDVTEGTAGRIVSVAATTAGPVVLSGEQLVLLGADGPRVMLEGIGALEPAAGGWLAVDGSGAATCLDPWAGPGGRCGHRLSPADGTADPFAQARWLRAVPARTGFVLEERWGDGAWKPVAGPFERAAPAALHFDVSSPGRIWLAGYRAGASRVWTSGDAGATWRLAGRVPGRVVALAGLGAGREGVLALRVAPFGPAMLVPDPPTGGSFE
jgi:hypothetical protein